MKRFSNLWILALLVAGILPTACFTVKETSRTDQISQNLLTRLHGIPEIVSIRTMEADEDFLYKYDLRYRQPIDHRDPHGPTFDQRVILFHKGFRQPVVIEIQGYEIFRWGIGEPAQLLQGNQVMIEHRFFAESKPDSIPWDKLTVWQAATDQHKVIRSIKRTLYTDNHFISTGISKGGQCTMIHRSLYPE